jgi:hypothetical protein
VPPGYTGPLPDGGYFIARSRTNRIVWFGRSFLENQADPKPVVETIKKFTKGLSLPARRVRHSDCRLPQRQGQARVDHPAAGDRIP